MMLRMPDHEVGAGLANLHTISHDLQVSSINVFAPFFRTVGKGFQADAMAGQAIFDALRVVMGHKTS